MELKSMLYRASLALTAGAKQMKITTATTPTEILVLGVKTAMHKVSEDVYNVACITDLDACLAQMETIVREITTLSDVVDNGFNHYRVDDIEAVKDAVEESYALMQDALHTIAEAA